MLHITGEGETLDDIKKGEAFEGPLADYIAKLKACNPHLRASLDGGHCPRLPSFSPLNLVLDPPLNYQAASTINSWSLEERKRLKNMQESGYDVFNQLALNEILSEAQSYSNQFRNYMDSPIISTPWNVFNQGLTNSSLPDLIGQYTSFGAGLINGSARFQRRETLYDSMLRRDTLNLQWMALRKEQGPKSIQTRQRLEKEIKELTASIKRSLKSEVDVKLSQFLSPDDLRKIRMGSYSKKMAKKGTLSTVSLDLLNKSGLERLRVVVSKLKLINKAAEKFSTYLGVGAVAYDTLEAYRNNGKVARTLFSGVAGFGVGSWIGATLGPSTIGAFTVGAAAGDLAVGTTILACCPVVGWVALTVVGIAVTGYVAYQATEGTAELWDYGEQAYNKVVPYVQNIYDEMKRMWESGSHWVLDFYGSK